MASYELPLNAKALVARMGGGQHGRMGFLRPGMHLMRLKDSKGFTLTEILVVSVIIAILSAGAVPVYTNYIKDQRIDAVKNLASAAAVSANVIYRRTNIIPACDGTDDCAGPLNLLLPEAGRYTVKTYTDAQGRHVTVTDGQHPEATYTASF